MDRRDFLKYAGLTGITGAVALANAQSALAQTVLTSDSVTTDAIHAPTGRSATIVIAASDSSASSKAQADYVCDGTADASTLQSIIDTVALAGGGLVVLLRGLYLLKKVVRMKPHVVLSGEGKYTGTILKVADKIQSSLTSNADSGQKKLVVDDVTGFLVGQDVTIFDSSHTGYGNGDSSTIASIDVDTKTITLTSNLYHSYTTANSAYVFTSYSAIQFSGVAFANGLAYGVDGVTYAKIQNLEIDGNAANNSQGNYDEIQAAVNLSNSHFCAVKDCYIHDTLLGGITSSHYVDGSYDGSEHITLENNHIKNVAYKDGIHLHGTKKSCIKNNVIEDSLTYGIYLVSCSLNKFSNNHLKNGTDGYWVIDSTNNVFWGDVIHDMTHYGVCITSTVAGNSNNNSLIGTHIYTVGDSGINISNDANDKFVNCTLSACGNICILASGTSLIITNNNISMTAAANAITTSGAGNVISNNSVVKTGWGVGIKNTGANAAINGNYVSNGSNVTIENQGNNSNINSNVVITSNATPIVNTGTTCKIKNNSGYITENTGTATITASGTTVDVTHGLAATPTRVIITPTTSVGGKFPYVSAKGATTFTISIDSAAGTDISFDWQAVV